MASTDGHAQRNLGNPATDDWVRPRKALSEKKKKKRHRLCRSGVGFSGVGYATVVCLYMSLVTPAADLQNVKA